MSTIIHIHCAVDACVNKDGVNVSAAIQNTLCQ